MVRRWGSTSPWRGLELDQQILEGNRNEVWRGSLGGRAVSVRRSRRDEESVGNWTSWTISRRSGKSPGGHRVLRRSSPCRGHRGPTLVGRSSAPVGPRLAPRSRHIAPAPSAHRVVSATAWLLCGGRADEIRLERRCRYGGTPRRRCCREWRLRGQGDADLRDSRRSDGWEHQDR